VGGAVAPSYATTDPLIHGLVVLPTHLGTSTPASATAGSPLSITVTVLDAGNNVVTGYTGTVHFTSSDAVALLPADYKFTASDQGAHTFTNVVLKTAGAQTLSPRDVALSSLSGSAGTTVVAAAATQLKLSAPVTSTAGASFNA